jgi:hypothetical protein
VVINCDVQLLLSPEVFLGGLHGYVSEQKLDLFQFAAGDVTLTRACAAQIMRREVSGLSFRRAVFDEAPDHLLTDPVGPDGTVC